MIAEEMSVDEMTRCLEQQLIFFLSVPHKALAFATKLGKTLSWNFFEEKVVLVPLFQSHFAADNSALENVDDRF